MLLNAVVLAFREIRRNVLRSSLTTLGIVIGVASVITLVTLGNSATQSVTASIASMGSNLLTIMPGQQRGPGGASAAATPFRVEDADVMARDLTTVTDVAPIASTTLNVISGSKNRSTSITGTTNTYFTATDWPLAKGRFFTDSEERAGAAVCIIGDTIRKEVLDVSDPIGASIRLRSMSCRVIGLLAKKGESTFGQDRDATVVIPLRTLQRRLAGNNDIGQIQVSVPKSVSTARARQDVEQLLRDRRHLRPEDDNDFTIFAQEDLATAISGTTQTLTALLAAVAAISLLVGGIGIMNIMLVSVTERTREIGIRLAIGAFETDVLTQFLVEAVVLSAFGGLMGIVFALAASAIATAVLHLPFSINVPVILLAFLFSAGVGVVFGFFPARRAAQLNPIDALRHE
ncbi:MAG TPA: ABC transporter permease [Vicinamibacterales bacterium]|nr:ABC transporter permease [Vicinamibacterales bacterium]